MNRQLPSAATCKHARPLLIKAPAKPLREASALPSIADMFGARRNVRPVPCVDGSRLVSQNVTSRRWSVQPCVRPVSAVRMTAGHMATADRVPVKSPHSIMHWHMWVVPIAGSTGFCINCCSSSQLSHHAGYPAQSLHAASAAGSL